MEEFTIPKEEKADILPIFTMFWKSKDATPNKKNSSSRTSHLTNNSDELPGTMNTEEEQRNNFLKLNSNGLLDEKGNLLNEVSPEESENNPQHISMHFVGTPSRSAKYSMRVVKEPTKEDSYHDILLKSANENILIEKFQSEKRELKTSNAKDIEFALPNSMERLKIGTKVWKYHYNKPTKKEVQIRLRNEYFEYLSRQTWVRISGKFIYGILIGNGGSTFKIYNEFAKKNKLEIDEPTNCFSVMTEIRTYDFSTPNDIVRYDLCITLSWLGSLQCKIPTSLPLTKKLITFKVIKIKIEISAKEKSLSIVELFLLAIYITIKEQNIISNKNSCLNEISVISKMLRRRFTNECKLFRFIFRSTGRNFDRTASYEQIRVNYLKMNRFEKLKKNLPVSDARQELKRKKTSLMSFLTPSIKSLFRKKKANEIDNGSKSTSPQQNSTPLGDSYNI
ncbi:unnamed protein product [Blepharisma stoltei]|uniref:K Homology domain-containing protein n=1 Tax=Blepharisma stoltei TaxID=1481888 RepID=A0AAU9KC94_9CILI|nr:unnamed protein product [Blepharisma stoltei]